MMKVKEILQLPLQSINDVPCNQDIQDVYIGDLLSVVMAIAELHEFAGIVFVQNNYPDRQTIQKATDLQIPLFVSQQDAFHLAKELIALGL